MKNFIDFLMQQMLTLSPSQQVAFSAALAERMLPYYERCDGYEWCQPRVIEDMIGKIWAHAKGEALLSDGVVTLLAQQVLKFSPDMDEISDFDALDACRVFSFSIKACRANESSMSAVAAAEVAIENAGRSSEYEDDCREYWETSPVADEVIVQQKMLTLLSHRPVVDGNVTERMRALVKRKI